MVRALVIFLSAFLLFQVEPIIARFLVGWFGGSAAVWTTCLLFFQIALLGGYLYAHASATKLPTKKQANLHLGLLLLSGVLVALTHITPPAILKPPGGGGDPSGRILWVLFLTVGVPYFTLSTTGPLIQAWTVRVSVAQSKPSAPYRLYSLSNIGSMLALLSYPVVIEPLLTAYQQAWIWSGAYLVFAGLCGWVAWRVRGLPDEPPKEAAAAQTETNADTPPAPKPMQYAGWVGLSACASVLLIAVTNHISQNVAAVPLLWILPLSLYLLTFIWAFGLKTWTWNKGFLPFPALAFIVMAYALNEDRQNMAVNSLIPLWLFGLFVCCLLCHGELARQKPDARYLTGFYLMISVGGAVGGLFVALLAPRIFPAFYELPLSIGACAVIALFVLYREKTDKWYEPFWLIAAALTGYLLFTLQSDARKQVADCRVSLRSFYGVLQVRDTSAARTLANGTILHGSQFLQPEKSRIPTTYYGPDSGVGKAIRIARQSGKVRVGVIGLGTGTLAAYGNANDDFTFYEINAQDEWVARHEFSYLPDCAAQTRVVLGDARLSLESEPAQNFDVLAVDAFSSDSIPIHLLTREAFGEYFRHLKPNGILAVHVSNRYVDLQPVVGAGAAACNKTALVVWQEAREESAENASQWVLVSDRDNFARLPLLQDATPPHTRDGFRPWTDGFSNLFQLVKANAP